MPEGHAITGLHRDNLMPGTGSMPVRQPAFVPLAVADLHFEEALSPLSSARLAPLICCLVSQIAFRKLIIGQTTKIVLTNKMEDND